jgi:hypothetical protein
MIDGINGRNFGRGLSKEYLEQILFFHSVSSEEDFQRSPILQLNSPEPKSQMSFSHHLVSGIYHR